METIREIDLEVKRIIDDCGKVVFEILTNRRPVLEQMSRELLECEVMDAAHLRSIIDQHKTVPQLSPGTFVNHPVHPAETPPAVEEPLRRESADGGLRSQSVNPPLPVFRERAGVRALLKDPTGKPEEPSPIGRGEGFWSQCVAYFAAATADETVIVPS